MPVIGTGPADVYLHPGQIYVSRTPVLVSMVLGSCVSVCLYDAETRVGGANHFLLPHDAVADEVAGRFGPPAIRELAARLRTMGARSLTAAVVGGANVLEAFRGKGRHIGAENVDVALRTLDELHIRVHSREVGGTEGRRLTFSSGDGRVWVKAIRS